MKIYNVYFPPKEDVSSNQISPRAQFSLENVFPIIIICRVRSKIAWRFTLLNKNIERGLIYNRFKCQCNRFKCQCILFHLREILLVISYRYQNRGDILHHYDLLETGGYFIVVNFHKNYMLQMSRSSKYSLGERATVLRLNLSMNTLLQRTAGNAPLVINNKFWKLNLTWILRKWI